MATASKPRGVDAGILATIRRWQNQGLWRILFDVAAHIATERDREQMARRDWRDTKFPREKRTPEKWHEIPDAEMPQIPDLSHAAETYRRAAESLERQGNELLDELLAIRGYVREHAPTLEYLIPLVNPGVDEPPDTFTAMATNMVKLAGELVTAMPRGTANEANAGVGKWTKRRRARRDPDGKKLILWETLRHHHGTYGDDDDDDDLNYTPLTLAELTAKASEKEKMDEATVGRLLRAMIPSIKGKPAGIKSYQLAFAENPQAGIMFLKHGQDEGAEPDVAVFSPMFPTEREQRRSTR